MLQANLFSVCVNFVCEYKLAFVKYIFGQMLPVPVAILKNFFTDIAGVALIASQSFVSFP